jgi:hypothetical protein
MARPGLTAPGAARLLGFERMRVLKTPAAAIDGRRLVVTLVPADLTAAVGAAVAGDQPAAGACGFPQARPKPLA